MFRVRSSCVHEVVVLIYSGAWHRLSIDIRSEIADLPRLANNYCSQWGRILVLGVNRNL